MPLFVFLLLVAGCADYQRPATFPRAAAHQPVIDEQALLALSSGGDALVASLISADGEPPELNISIFDAQGGPTKRLAAAPTAIAARVADELLRRGRTPLPLLEPLVREAWPEAYAHDGFRVEAPAIPEPGTQRYPVAGIAPNGSLPLVVRIASVEGTPRATALFISGQPGGAESELARMPLAGQEIAPRLYIQSGVAWLVAGSFAGEPLHRTAGVRRGSLAHGEAELHNAHGLEDYGAGDLDAARREFARATAADPAFVDAVYNSAAAAALMGDDPEALAFLRRAAALDPARVQVLGRNDEDLKSLRTRADVRALLGMKRPPPVNVPPPP